MDKFNIKDIVIRNDLKPGDIGYITYLHGILYSQEYNYGIEFESYVAAGLQEFFQNYNHLNNRAWICEHDRKIVGFLLLMKRDYSAQLRYFILLPEYRGIGLGKKLIDLFMEFLLECGYKHAYLWTTNELHSAAHLYLKYGFKLSEEKKSDAFGKYLTEQKYDLYL
ncbi:MAG: GNAT family N-acetyltransferase [Bacteroidota bacterium]|nr:GNAT family N-acetyltransferase [Bacteroidota bacterium]